LAVEELIINKVRVPKNSKIHLPSCGDLLFMFLYVTFSSANEFYLATRGPCLIFSGIKLGHLAFGQIGGLF
jgi:hypothetical protein